MTEAEAIVQKVFATTGMIQSGLEARDFALWCAEHDIADILELGTCVGGTLYLMHLACKPGLRITLDYAWDQRDPKAKPGSEALLKYLIPEVVEILGNAHDENQRRRVGEFLAGRKVDLLFIDCDHSYDGCKRHVEMYREFVRKGGYMAFHDVSNGWPCGNYVRQELFPLYEHWLMEDPKALYGIGIVKV